MGGKERRKGDKVRKGRRRERDGGGKGKDKKDGERKRIQRWMMMIEMKEIPRKRE